MKAIEALALVAGHVDEEILRRNEYLAAENEILRSKIKGRLMLNDAERIRLVAMGHILAQYDWGRFMANVNALRRTAGGWEGVADPRLGGTAKGY